MNRDQWQQKQAAIRRAYEQGFVDGQIAMREQLLERFEARRYAEEAMADARTDVQEVLSYAQADLG